MRQHTKSSRISVTAVTAAPSQTLRDYAEDAIEALNQRVLASLRGAFSAFRRKQRGNKEKKNKQKQTENDTRARRGWVQLCKHGLFTMRTEQKV